jgi:hypothetical protein
MADGRKTPLPPSLWWFWIVVAVYVACVGVSVGIGAPRNLPGIALGSPLLLDLERGGAGFLAIAAVFVFAWLTRLGHLPSQLGNVARYSSTDPVRQEIAQQATYDTVRMEERLGAVEERITGLGRGLEIVLDLLESADE